MSTTTTTLTATDGKPVETTLNYYLDPSKGGHNWFQVGVVDYYRRKFDVRPVQIHDIRGKESRFQLDNHGFQHCKHVSVEDDFDDDARIKRDVYPETEQLIKEIAGATRVHIFSHIVRRDSREAAEKAIKSDPSLQDGDAPYMKQVPASFIHVDFSEDGAKDVLQNQFDATEIERLTKTPWAIINVWRAIKPICKDPMAFCDVNTMREKDLMPVWSELPPKGTGPYSSDAGSTGFELYYKRHSPGEKWYYVNRMQQDEILMFKIYDSRTDGETARSCPHTAFSNPATEQDSPRESMEIRALVFFEDQKL